MAAPPARAPLGRPCARPTTAPVRASGAFTSCGGLGVVEGMEAEAEAQCAAACTAYTCAGSAHAVLDPAGSGTGSSSGKKRKWFPAAATVTLADGSTKAPGRHDIF